jgi:hypothetical protein
MYSLRGPYLPTSLSDFISCSTMAKGSGIWSAGVTYTAPAKASSKTTKANRRSLAFTLVWPRAITTSEAIGSWHVAEQNSSQSSLPTVTTNSPSKRATLDINFFR